ncbi:hypothetical protein N7475_007414 [Penicillium sp. IBT 31633x]|nr:hypothetical protein N7475_007414 [Penicillium sp. IBT 31633x]
MGKSTNKGQGQGKAQGKGKAPENVNSEIQEDQSKSKPKIEHKRKRKHHCPHKSPTHIWTPRCDRKGHTYPCLIHQSRRKFAQRPGECAKPEVKERV